MAPGYKWAFTARFRSEAYGWRASALATKRLKEAVTEIQKAAKPDPLAAGGGVVMLMERIWPALQHVDSSSGALGNAVNRTLEALIPLLIAAPAERKTREQWMERLYQALVEDGVNYLSPVEGRWGDICVFADLASEWANRIFPLLRQTWASGERGAWVIGATLCLSCLVEAERFSELQDVLSFLPYRFWHYEKFLAEALLRQGRTDDAIAYAEECGEDPYAEGEITRFCERALLEAGRREEAYQRYGLWAATGTTYLAIFRNTAKRYPERDPRQILLDLINARGSKGKWFAAAKSAGHLDVALECARKGTTDPATLVRAARDFVETAPEFAAQVALLAIKFLLDGRGYEPRPLDIGSAHRHLMAAADRLRATEWAMRETLELLANPSPTEVSIMRDELVASFQDAQRQLRRSAEDPQ